MPDGDFLEADWLEANGIADPTAADPASPILVILHGLEGSSDASYARLMAMRSQAQGWRTVVLHFRDCGGTGNRLPRRYHAGDTEDPRFFLDQVRRRWPEAPLLGAGFSLGGNVLLKLLGEEGSDSALRAAVAVSVPFDLQNAADALNTGFSRFYRWYLLKKMKQAMRRKFTADDAPFDWQAAHRARDFARFDDVVTAPLHGFDGKDDYYGRCSCGRYLGGIQVPTLILNARDDPFMTPDAIPEAGTLPTTVRLEVTETGGHIGFVDGSVPWRPEYWLPGRLMHFLGEEVLVAAPERKNRYGAAAAIPVSRAEVR